MYLTHWKLARPPFEAQPDSRFLFATVQHDRALAAISYAACDGGEPVLLAGAAGCGKTLLLRALRRRLPREQFRVAFVPEAGCAQVGLLRRVAYHLTHAVVADSAAAMDAIVKTAEEARTASGALVTMLDGWPADVPAEQLAELRWLLDLDLENGRSSVLLTSEDAWAPRRWPDWLVQRLFSTAELGPLTPAEVGPYLAHRLSAASQAEAAPAERPNYAAVFTPDAAARIAEWSWGVPRLINRAAHLALHVAWLELAVQVTPQHVAQAIERLLPPGTPRTGSGTPERTPSADSPAADGDAAGSTPGSGPLSPAQAFSAAAGLRAMRT
ncbi:MAG: AAA family ATPase [Planctomycetota bacterium]